MGLNNLRCCVATAVPPSHGYGRFVRGGLARVAAAAVCAALCASARAAETQSKRSGFEAVPRQALVELKATVGKPFTSGLVFINGKYITPPYTVERYGTAIRINQQQVTGQVIRWDEFLKTQAGARVEQPATPPEPAESEYQSAGDSDATTDATSDASPYAASYNTSDVTTDATTEVSSDGVAYDFDDLFDDGTTPKKRTTTTRTTTPRRTAPAATIVFDGQFKQNEKTRAYLASINKLRTDIEIALRKGGCYFFGTKYSMIAADQGPTDMFLAAMPLVMKNNNTFAAFSSAARAKGVTYLSETVMRDLFRNRLDYIRLQDRAKKVKDEHKWSSILDGIP